MLKTHEEYILDLYHRYRVSGWRFRRVSYNDGIWGVSFACAGTWVRIWVEHGRVYGAYTTGDYLSQPVNIGVNGDMTSQAYETLYRRLDKKAGVICGK